MTTVNSTSTSQENEGKISQITLVFSWQALNTFLFTKKLSSKYLFKVNTPFLYPLKTSEKANFEVGTNLLGRNYYYAPK